MHRRPKAELLPLDTKIEKTLRNLKNVRATEATVMAKQREGNQNVPILATDTSTEVKNNGGFLETSYKGRVLSSETIANRDQQF